jgi:twinkle protein
MKGEIMAEFVKHTACEKCGSSDAKAVYSDGTAYCFSCETYFGKSGNVETAPQDFTPVEVVPINTKIRGISPETFRFYNYFKDHKGNHCINHFDREGKLVAQKFRYPDKTFSWRGKPQKAVPFGLNNFSEGGRIITITEGELDALSVAEAFDRKWAVISINNGASSAKKDLKKYIDVISSYEKIYLWFDNDEPGRKAIKEVATLFPPGKVYIIQHPTLKDANEVLMKEGKQGVIKTFYSAKKYLHQRLAH